VELFIIGLGFGMGFMVGFGGSNLYVRYFGDICFQTFHPTEIHFENNIIIF
jgi:hypothetical protein